MPVDQYAGVVRLASGRRVEEQGAVECDSGANAGRSSMPRFDRQRPTALQTCVIGTPAHGLWLLCQAFKKDVEPRQRFDEQQCAVVWTAR